MGVIQVALEPLTVQHKASTTTTTEVPPQDTTTDTEVAPATDLIPFWATVATGDTAALVVDITINSDRVGVTICPQR